MPDQPDLLPCPFCGGDCSCNPFGGSISEPFTFFVICHKCGAQTRRYGTAEQAIAAWNTRADRWIPVSERLPEPFVDVNGYSKSGVNIGYFTASGLWYEEGADMSWRNITHWMPQPALPEEVEGW